MSEKETVHKVTRLVDVRVTIEPPAWIYSHTRYDDNPIERQAKLIEEWVKEFQAFVRDHRSQDEARMDVERVTEEQCSGCGRPWEPSVEGPYCAGCGRDIEHKLLDPKGGA